MNPGEESDPDSPRERGSGPQAEDGQTPAEGQEKKRRRKRDPFANDPHVSSSAAAVSSRQLTTLSDMKRIKKARIRHEGKRVVTDDVKKLKSLSIEPQLPAGEFINYYVEPVRIEYYIPRESRFAIETKFLYIPLIDPVPRPEDEILSDYIAQNRFLDVVDIMNEYPQYITEILESYNTSMPMLETLSTTIMEAAHEEDLYRRAFYLCETLAGYEPTLAALEFLGQFMHWNINWLVRRLNSLGIEFFATDKTVAFFIKMRNEYWEAQGYGYDERFEILAALFFEQAFPNRGLDSGDEDYFMNAFNKK